MATKINRCGCGCGAEVARQFLPGHDSKLRHQLAEALRDGRKFRIYNRSYDPVEYIREHEVHGMDGVIAETRGPRATASGKRDTEAARAKSARSHTRELERQAAADVVRSGRGRRDSVRS